MPPAGRQTSEGAKRVSSHSLPERIEQMQPQRIYHDILDESPIPEGAVALNPKKHFCGFWPIYYDDMRKARIWAANKNSHPNRVAVAKKRMQEIVDYFKEWATTPFSVGTDSPPEKLEDFMANSAANRYMLNEMINLGMINLCSTLDGLRGKNIASPMPPEWPCISDVLIELANLPARPKMRITYAWEPIPDQQKPAP